MKINQRKTEKDLDEMEIELDAELTNLIPADFDFGKEIQNLCKPPLWRRIYYSLWMSYLEIRRKPIDPVLEQIQKDMNQELQKNLPEIFPQR